MKNYYEEDMLKAQQKLDIVERGLIEEVNDYISSIKCGCYNQLTTIEIINNIKEKAEKLNVGLELIQEFEKDYRFNEKKLAEQMNAKKREENDDADKATKTEEV